MKAILLDEAKKWLEENCENQYTRMAVFGIMQSMPTVDYQETPNEPLTLDALLKMDGQPVYVVFRPDNSCDKPQFWALVSADKQHDEVYLLDSMGGAGSYDEIWANIEAIYRRPPEGEEAGNG